MGCNMEFNITDDELILSLEEDDLLELYELINEEMELINEVEVNGDVDNNIEVDYEFEFNNELMHDDEIESDTDTNNNDESELNYDGDVDTDLDSESDINELNYDADVDSNADSDCDNQNGRENRPASLSLLMGNLPEHPPVPSIPQTPPTILHPVQPDPAQVLSWEIYNLSRQIDQYLNEFISELQQNTPPPPSIYYYPIRFEENLETGEQILEFGVLEELVGILVGCS